MSEVLSDTQAVRRRAEARRALEQVGYGHDRTAVRALAVRRREELHRSPLTEASTTRLLTASDEELALSRIWQLVADDIEKVLL